MISPRLYPQYFCVFITACLALCVTQSSVTADVLITEFMADNKSTLLDEDGDDPDWIEIYNSGGQTVSLEGYCLTDNSADLGKWAFPAVNLASGEFMIVYASGKDRKTVGQPLHANFSLQASGEYLALVAPDKVTVLQEFAPEFSRHEPDESFGVPFDGTPLVVASASARVHVPSSGALGTTWTGNGFNDGGWQSGDLAVGFGLTVAGFTVREVKSSGSQIRNLSDADDLLSGLGVASETTAILPFVDLYDTGGAGRFNNDLPLPNGGGDDFVVAATGTIEIPTAGTWTFGTTSDDGVRVRINGSNVINDDALHAVQDRFGTRTLAAGNHSIELVFFERGGGAEVELFAAQGSFNSFNGNFKLIGDTAAGGLAVFTSQDNGVISTSVETEMSGIRSSAYVRVPFSVANVNDLESLSLSMRYNDGFVAFINGVEVARKNAPSTGAWNSTATSSRDVDDSLIPEGFNASAALATLVNGTNVLVIHGLNSSAGDSNFLVAPELVGGGLGVGAPAYFAMPTPGGVNSETVSLGRVLDPDVSPSRGTYSNAQTVTIVASTPGATIRYTTNGSPPTASSGNVYSSPITVDETTVLRVAAFKTGFDPSRVKTHTYLFLDDVIQQSENAPPGWPTSSVNGQQFNYGMDPEIVSGNEAAVMSALSAVPSISIALKQSDLTSSSGIYTNAGSRGFSWERPASVELINDPDGGFQADAGLRIRGGFSRSSSNPKHALRLFFRAEYGDAKLDYPLFGVEGADRFDNIDLRTSQNYSWAFQGNGSNTFLREVFARDSQRAMGQPYTRSRYYHLYLNGQYWGLYMTQERAEASYGESYFGGDSDDYDVVKSAGSSGGYRTEATDGTMGGGSAWDQLWQRVREIGTTNPSNANYYSLQGLSSDGMTPTGQAALLDVDNLVDYMLAVYYTGGFDAPLSTFLNNASNNWFGMRNSMGSNGFVFFMHDNEHSLGTGGNSNNRVGAGGSNTPWKVQYGTVTDYTRSNPQYLHEDLASNGEYRMAFADRAHELLFNRGALTRDAVIDRIEQRRAVVEQVILAEAARWGDSKRSTPYSTSNWQSAVSDMINFVDKGTDGSGAGPGRAAVLVSQLRGFDGGNKALYPSIDAPSFSQHGGYISSTTELSMTGGSILYTTGGSDPRQIGGGTDGSAISYQGSSSTLNLITSGSSWRYLDNGSDQGTAWRGSGFNDGGWKTGNAQLGYGDGDEATVVSFGGDSNDKHTTTYFRKSFQVTGTAQTTALSLELLRDDGAVVYINGAEVARSNMPSGTITFNTTSDGVVGGGDESTFFLFDLDFAVLVEGTNVIAVEIHQTSGTSSDISFDMRLNATQTFASNPLTLQGPGEVRLMSRAKEGGTWSALNEALFFVDMDPPSSANLMISEIHYHPAAPSAAELAAGFLDANDFEFVELMNIGNRMVNLRDARFVNGISFDFNNGTITSIAPGGRVVLVRNRAAFEFRYGNSIAVAGEFAGSLSNSGELLRIEGPSGETIRDFSYDDAAPWPESADGLGFSLVLNSPNSAPEHSDSGNWAASSSSGGSPGASGSNPVLPILVNEVLAHTDFPQVDSIELYNPNGIAVDLGGWFLSDDFGEPKKYQIPAGTSIAAEGYLVIEEDNDANPDNNASLPSNYFGSAFSLSSLGDEAYIFSGDGSGNLTGFSDGFSFRASANGVSFGRWINSEGILTYPSMGSLTLGSANAAPAQPSLLINEIMYHPQTAGLEFVELWNRSGVPLPLFDPANPENTWFVNGIGFSFPQGQTLAPDELALVVEGDPETFRSANGLSPGVKIFGPFPGSLDNDGERLSVRRPDEPSVDGSGATVVPMIDVDIVRFNDAPPWPVGADGSGPSLERINFEAYSDDVQNWSASAEVGGTPGVLRGLLPLSLSTQGEGVVTANPSQSNFLEGATVELTPTAASGWEFSNWSGDASDSVVPLVVTMNEAKSIVAVFQERYDLSVGSIAGGAVTVNPDRADYGNGDIVNIQATPATGYRFAGWSGDLSGTSNPTTLTMNSDKSIGAVFVRQFTLELIVGTGGNVSADPDQEVYDEGATVTITAAPANGFAFSNWGGDADGATNPLSVVITKDLEVTAAFAPLVSLTTSVNGQGAIQQSPEGSQFVAGTEISFTALPSPGWAFTGWSGDLNGGASPQTLNLADDSSVTANFVQVFSVLTTVTSGEGSLAISPAGSSFAAGSVLSISATPATGYRFGKWGGDLEGSVDNPASLTVNGNKSLSASFVRQWKLTVGEVEGGEATASPNAAMYDHGVRVVVTAVPEEGYVFSGWTGDAPGDVNPATIVMDSSKVLTPRFVRAYVVSTSATGQGAIEVSPAQEMYPVGTTVSFTALPAEGWQFAQWGGDASGTAATVSVEIDRAIAVEATFSQLFSLDVDVTGEGSVSLNPGGGSYLTGTTVMLTASPSNGYSFVGWGGDSSGSVNPLQVTIDADKSISASFESTTTPFEAWLASHFSQQEITDGALTQAAADGDGDGFGNLIEFGAGTDPRSKTDFPQFVLSVVGDGTFAVSLDRPQGISGVAWLLEVSDEISRWNHNEDGSGETYSEEVEVTGIGAGRERLTFRSNSAEDATQSYFRLRAELLED